MYRERPSALLAGAVVWQRTVPDAGPALRVLPDGCLDLIWVNGTLLVAGPDTTAQLASPPPGTQFIGLRFPPGTGPAVLGVPACELRDRRVPLAQLWSGAELRRLTDTVETAPAAGAAMEAAAAARLRETAPPDPVLAEVARRLGGGTPVAEVAAGVGLSERQLHRRSLAGFGYGPKTLMRVLRLTRAVELARDGTALATVAYATGYADQAHLAHEVRDLAGVPLGVLIR